ncbi:hypothetical protein E2O24_07125 [Campylobacter volucris]|uniref:autotransporter outer membrane beta-barrel domain-containing protein n=1 Tax=Campylobacter volucris TaxID=1031542 RepID=UPI00105A8282|nr:autotransporter outer membrane beta-barrel domain-containing protein [Campylobacter volucris]TDJ85831.1 hypothetical protein E2O24_07125 [Campylobacter volucris]
MKKDANGVSINNKGNIINTNSKNESALIKIGDSGNGGGGATLTNFTNSGTIGGTNNQFAIASWGSKNKKSTITTFDNSGIISGYGEGIKLTHTNIQTLNNSGTIKGGYAGMNVNEGANITSLNNAGTIEGRDFGVVLWSGKINTFINETNGVVKGKSGIALEGQWSSNKIDTIVNKGTIISTGVSQGAGRMNGGILVEFQGSIDTIKNEGLIDTKGAGINMGGNGTMAKLIENSGTIKFTGTANDTNEGFGTGSGIHVQNHNGIPTVETIKNSGLIDAHNGVYVALGSTVENLENTGIIKATKDGIALGNNRSSWENWQTEVKTITNKGTILADRYGVFIDIANNPSVPFKLGQINISGLIAGGVAGMYIGENQKLTNDINVEGTLTGGTAGIINNGIIGSEDGKGGIKLNGGTISAFGSSYFRAGVGPAILNTGNGIIYGDTELNNKAQLIGGVVNSGNGKLIGDIHVKNGSSISGGITNADNGVVTGSIKIEGEGSKVDSITNTGNGTISGGVSVGQGSSVENVTNSGNGTISGSITNDGNLGSINNSGNISGNIENNNGDVQINNDGKLDGAIQVGENAGNTAISNGSNGNIGGGITNNSSSNISINNQGTVKPDSNGNHITNNGGGSVTVEDWVISTDSSGKVESVNVGGSNAANTTVDKVTVETNGNLDLGQSINPEDLIQNTTNGGSISSGSVQVGTGENANPAIALYKDPRTGKYVFAVNAGASIASMMLQTVVDQTSRRSLMIDTLMDQSAYKFHHWNKKSSKNGIEPKENIDGFFLPYRSYNKINLSDNAGVSSGHTTGYIAGFNALKDDGIYGVYLGTENNNFNNANVFDLDTKAYYGGVKFSNILKTGPYYDVVLGTHLKAAVLKNDLTRFIEKLNNASLTSKGKTDSYAYGINTNLAINYYLSDKTAITPAFGLGYEGGHTKAFSMVGDAAFDHERYYSNTLNLIQTKASLKWFQIWNDKISTVVEGGARFNLNDTLDSTVNFNGGKYTGSIDLPRVYGYSNFSFIYSLTKNLDLSLNYNGIASDNSGQTHTGYLEFNFKY